MKFDAIQFIDKLGRKVCLRNAEEVTITLEQEKCFIQRAKDVERELLLIAEIDGKHIGNCSLMNIASYKRYGHRCGLAIALYQEYCGCGIGKVMMQTVLDVAKNTDYEQAELEVISENQKAIALYRNLGFEKYGTFPNNMKYADGTYASADWMMKKL